MAPSTPYEQRPAHLSAEPVPAYTLPDVLAQDNGTPVKTPADWRTRRASLLELFRREVYGRAPLGRPDGACAHVEKSVSAFGGLARRKPVRLYFGTSPDVPWLDLLLYVPVGVTKPPVLLGLNFYGNHSVTDDPAIPLTPNWVPNEAPGSSGNRATEASRGRDQSKWPIELQLRRGYAVATAYCGDLCPDRPDGLAAGVNGYFCHTTTESRPADAWGAIGVWAWGLSRILDYLETDPDVDARRVAVHGHSRLGKTALWAAAQDERLALAISNESGCGGAALSKRIHGETVAKINEIFPHWFAKRFRAYNANEAALPVDQHELLALIAPRPLYVASAEGDDWADPLGEFLSVQAAAPVYQLLTGEPSPFAQYPNLHSPLGNRLRYHVRSGPHDMTAYDWDQYLSFADRWLTKPQRAT